MDRPSPAWPEAAFAGDRAALARALSAVENDGAEAPAVLAAAYPRLGRALVVGVTGPPGVGKSTLTGALIGALRGRGLAIGVVAVDPSSPLSGGALLGDRIRMAAHATDDDVFIRSLAARGTSGGLSLAAVRLVDVLDAAGKDVVLVETVGTGQSELAVAGLADVTVLVAAPGLGDAVQALKAGALEVADILVVNKADRPEAERTAGHLRRCAGARPVLSTVATTGAGIAALAEVITASRQRRRGPRRRARRLIAEAAAEALRTALEVADDPALDALAEALLKGDTSLAAATLEASRLASQVSHRTTKNDGGQP